MVRRVLLSIISLPQIAERHVMVNSSRNWEPTIPIRILLRLICILSYKGVLYKKHLLGGVAKGAFSESDAEAKFNKWMTEKESKIAAKVSRLATEAKNAEKAALAAETKVKEDRAAAIAEKKAAAEAAAAEAAAQAAAEEGAEAAETPAE